MGFQLIGFSEVVIGYFGKLTYFFNLCMLPRPSFWKLSIGHLWLPTSQPPSCHSPLLVAVFWWHNCHSTSTHRWEKCTCRLLKVCAKQKKACSPLQGRERQLCVCKLQFRESPLCLQCTKGSHQTHLTLGLVAPLVLTFHSRASWTSSWHSPFHLCYNQWTFLLLLSPNSLAVFDPADTPPSRNLFLSSCCGQVFSAS